MLGSSGFVVTTLGSKDLIWKISNYVECCSIFTVYALQANTSGDKTASDLRSLCIYVESYFLTADLIFSVMEKEGVGCLNWCHQNIFLSKPVLFCFLYDTAAQSEHINKKKVGVKYIQGTRKPGMDCTEVLFIQSRLNIARFIDRIMPEKKRFLWK